MELDVPFENKNSPKQEIIKRFNVIDGCELKHEFSNSYKLIKKKYVWKFEIGNETIAEIDIRDNVLQINGKKTNKLDITINKNGKEFVEQIMDILLDLENKFKDVLKIIVHTTFKHPIFDKLKCADEL